MSDDFKGIEVQLSQDVVRTDSSLFDNSSVQAQFPSSIGKVVDRQRTNELQMISESSSTQGLGEDLKITPNTTDSWLPERQDYHKKKRVVKDYKKENIITSRNDNESSRNTEERRVHFRDDISHVHQDVFIDNDEEQMRVNALQNAFADNDEEQMRQHVPQKVSTVEDVNEKKIRDRGDPKRQMIEKEVNSSLGESEKSHWLPQKLADYETGKSRSGAGGSCGPKRKGFFIILVYFVLIGLIGWLVKEYLKIPGLYDEINDLSNQIDRLSDEIGKFKIENDRLKTEVDRLEGINDNLEQTALQLSEENDQTKELVSQFNNSLLEYQNQNQILHEENEKYEIYTAELNQTVISLVSNLTEVTESETNLAKTVEEFTTMASILESEIIILTNQTGDLNDTVTELSQAVTVFEAENQQLSELNDDLGLIVSFLETEANSVQTSYSELAQQLADTILYKQVLAEIGLKERMKADIAGWECGLLTAFANQDFSEDQELPIGYSNYDYVMNYISDSLLSDLCIERGNLELYLRSEIVPNAEYLWEINMQDLTFGINIYSASVLKHYFPDENDPGVEDAAWNAANYDCKNLDFADKYFYSNRLLAK